MAVWYYYLQLLSVSLLSLLHNLQGKFKQFLATWGPTAPSHADDAGAQPAIMAPQAQGLGFGGVLTLTVEVQNGSKKPLDCYSCPGRLWTTALSLPCSVYPLPSLVTSCRPPP